MIRFTRLSKPPMPRGLVVPAGRLGLRRFCNDQKGATAVEFGLVAFPFLALIFAIIETAIAFWSATVLDTAVTDASRRLYTGQFQQANATAQASDLPTKFRDEVCKSIVALFSCASIKIDVRPYDAFPNQAAVFPVTPAGDFDAANFGQYQSPGSDKIVVVRAAVEIPVFVSLLSPKQTNLRNGNRLIMGTATFRTEPFGQ